MIMYSELKSAGLEIVCRLFELIILKQGNK